jgi:hypothetical protein
MPIYTSSLRGSNTALQPSTNLTQAAITAATPAGVALLDADVTAQKTLLGIANIVDPSSPLSAVTYDGTGRATGFTRAGTAFVIAYPSSTSITISGGGKVTTITLDANGRVISKQVV